jgi:thioredoxin
MIRRPVAVTDATFEQAVLASPLPVVVDFWAAWCAPCKLVHTWMERLAETYAGRLVVASVDVDACPATIAAYGVKSVPVILFIREGALRHRQADSLTETELRALVERHLLGAPPKEP